MSDNSSTALWHPAPWPAPPRVRTAITGRAGGASQPPYAALNLALHVGDDAKAVAENRRRLLGSIDAERIFWLQQVHGTALVEADLHSPVSSQVLEADGCFTTAERMACAVLTADCVPVLICDRFGRQVAAIHAGWRGLVDGILGNAIGRFEAAAEQLLAYLGPAISAAQYEVDDALLDAVRARGVGLQAGEALWRAVVRPRQGKAGHYWFNLHALARWQLQQLGVHNIYGGDECTFSLADRYYSFRRDGRTGRFASLIWIAPR